MYDDQIKVIKHIQDMADETQNAHSEIQSGINELNNELKSLDGYDEVVNSQEYKLALEREKNKPAKRTPLEYKSFDEIKKEADEHIKRRVTLNDILTPEDFREVDERVYAHVEEFNREYALDLWDYAIAGSCGLIAGMLDVMCVKAPLKPSEKFDTPADGVFNRAVQEAFNKLLPPDVSKKLSESFKIGSADANIKTRLKKFLGKLTPKNHRLKALSHDPILGLIFGVFDILNDSCTIVEGGRIRVYKAIQPNNFDGNVFNALGQMIGHLLSDINAPTPKGNRGMGLPAPFMGLLSGLRNVKINGHSVGDNIEYMYLKGYDMRQFVATSIPCLIMEILLRTCWTVKGISMEDKTLWTALSQTAPSNLHKKYRVMTAISYGVLCGINAGKIYITDNILNLNYAAWLGLTWNGFHALKWALFDKDFKLWNSFEKKELQRLEDTFSKIEELEKRVEFLPI